jgi:hypothetical protein
MNGHDTMLAEIDLSSEERDQVNALIERARANVYQAQQMAVDASRLLRKTDQTLADIEGTGFFKRLWHAKTGKHAQMMRATQADMIQMQRIAFGYLAALQDQNLLQAHAIAVIRHNLDEIADSVTETNENIGLLVAAFERRVGRVEDIVECHDWLLNLSMTDYSRMTPASRMVLITMGYVRRMHEAGIRFDRIERRNDITLALKKEGVDGQKPYLIEDLFSEIARDNAMDARAFAALVGALEGVTGHLVEERVPSLAAHALYRFAAAYPQIEAAREVLDFQASVHAIPAMIRRALPGPLTQYTLQQYAMELAAALFFALEVAIPAADTEHTGQFSPTPHIEVVAAEPSPGFSIDDLIGNLIPITRHAYLGTDPAQDDRKRYLESFAIVLSSTGGFVTDQRNYLTSLGEAYGVPDVEPHVDMWLVDVRQLPLKDMLAFIRQDNVIHAWLMDAVFIWTLGDRSHQGGRGTIEAMAKAMNLPIDFTKNFIDKAEVLATEPVGDSLLSAIRFLANHGTSWKTLVDYRKLSFKGAFSRETDRLWEHSSDHTSVHLDISKLSLNLWGLEPDDDDGFIKRAGMNVARRLAVSEFDGLKERAGTVGASQKAATYPAQSILTLFGFDDLPETLSTWRISADENVDMDNKAWLSNMQAACDNLERYLSSVDEMVGAARVGLWKIETGDW